MDNASDFLDLITDRVIPFIFQMVSLLCEHWYFVLLFAVFVISVVLDVFLEFADVDAERRDYWQFWK